MRRYYSSAGRRLLIALLLALATIPFSLLGSRPAVRAGLPITWIVDTTGDTGSPSAANCGGGHCPTLRDALLAAGIGDTVSLTGLSGTILTLSTLPLITNVTLTGPGPTLVVSGSLSHTVFSIANGVVAQFNGFSVENGNGSVVPRQGPGGVAGGIYNAGNLTLSNMVISDNTAQRGGGGIYSDGASSGDAGLTAFNTLVLSNTSYVGGGIYSISASQGIATVTISSSTVLSNSATYVGGGIYSDGSNNGTAALYIASGSMVAGNQSVSGGGGVFSNGGASGVATMTLSGSEVLSNTVTGTGGYGGGISSQGSYSGSAALTVTTSTVAGNSAPSGGGGVFSDGGNSGSVALSGADSSVLSNTSFLGAGIYDNASVGGTAGITLTNSTVSSNAASLGGGGPYNDGTSGGSVPAVVTASTLSDDSAIVGGGIFVNGGSAAAFTATNDLIARNTASAGRNCFIAAPPVSDLGGNLDDDGSCGFSAATSVSNAAAAGLGVLGQYGGTTQTVPLLPTSPALGLGVAAGCSAGGGVDQRGVVRPVVACDSGAFQAFLSLTPATLPAGTVDAAYSQVLGLAGGIAPLGFSSDPVIPAPGLNLNPVSGVLGGTLSAAGTFPFTVTATDSQASFGFQAYTLLVQKAQTSLSLASSGSLDLGASLPVTATIGAPMTPTAPTGTVVFTLTSNLGSSTVMTGTVSNGLAEVTFSAAAGAATYSLSATYGGDGNFLPSGASLSSTITQMGCAVNGSLVQAGVGSFAFLHIQAPSTFAGQAVGVLGGLLTVSHPLLRSCVTGGPQRAAVVTGSASGGSRIFPPGTALTLSLTLHSDGSAMLTVVGSNTKSATLVGLPTANSSRLTISAV